MDPKQKTLLIVEDDQDSRDALCTMLNALGYKTIAFGAAKEALAGIEDQKIDLALLDIMMPEMNGYELMEELKKLPEFQNTPFVMVTAKDKDSEILEGYQTGADYYITKPFTKKQLDYGIRIFLGEVEE